MEVAGYARRQCSPPPRRFVLPEALTARPPRTSLGRMSVGLFGGSWELLWFCGVTDPKLLPPPSHLFSATFPEQAQVLNTAQRWQIGVGLTTVHPPAWRS